MKPIAKPKFEVVRKTAAPYDEAKGAKFLIALRARLLKAAARHAKEGTSGTRGDRLRHASDLSGIPKNLIEVESER